MKKRAHAMCLRLTELEMQTLTDKAKKAGMSREQFCRSILDGAEVREMPNIEYRQFIRELRRIGSNIDQILRIAYTKAPLQVPDLKKALSNLVELEDRISEVYYGGDA